MTERRIYTAVIILAVSVPIIQHLLRIIITDNYFYFFKIIKVFLYIQLTIQFFQIIELIPNKGQFNHYFFPILRTGGFFSEPSTLAVSLSPFIFLCIGNLQLARRLLGLSGVLAVVVSLILSPSTTAVAVILLALAFLIVNLRFNNAHVVFFVSIVVGCGAVLTLIFVQDVFERVYSTFALLTGQNPETDLNFSALMFFKGYEMALHGITNFPFGVGILNFQSLAENSSISLLSYIASISNSGSGTSMLFKIIGEFGVFGIAFMLFAVVMFLKNNKDGSYHAIMQNFFIFNLFALAIRGNSYFDGTPLITISVIFMSYSIFRRSKKSASQNYLRPKSIKYSAD